MPAVVINGVFIDNNMQWVSASIGQASTGICLIPNTQNVPLDLLSAAISGTGAGDFSIPGGQLPVTLQPNQTAILQVTATPTGGPKAAILAVTTSLFGYTPQVLLVDDTGASALGMPYPTSLQFPTTKVGLTTNFAQVRVVNPRNASITVTNLSLFTGTDFFIVGAPITPFSLTPGQASALFTVQFSPTVIGGRNDTLLVTTAAGNGNMFLSGMGSTLQSAFNLTGGSQGTLVAVSGVSGSGFPSILQANPVDLNSEEASSFVKLHDFQIANIEKQVMRIRGHYEDLGVATATFTCKAKRIGQPDETIQVSVGIGTVAADGWIREFTSEPTPVTGELVQITISRAALGGPVSIIDYCPVFEPKGEVIGAT